MDTDALKQGLLAVQTLTEVQEGDIQRLATVCNEYEGLHMRFSLGGVHRRPENSPPDFLYYDNGRLVGCIMLDSFGAEEKELLGMVHPEHRRKGIFSALVAATKVASARHGVQRLIFVVERAASSGQGFVKAVGAQYDYSEHEMVLETFHDRMGFDERLNYRKAYDSDLDLLVSIMADSFGDAEERVRPWVSRLLHDPQCRLYVSTFGEAQLGCKEPVGCLRLHESDDSIGIYGFGVRPEYRGRGYGRQMLEETIREVQEKSKKQLTLEVDIDNENAIGLYRSVGFVVRTTYDYYKVEIG